MTPAAEANEGRLLPHERHFRILEQARSHSRVEVSVLAADLEVTTETIRRDLALLERQGQLRRVHGGAVHVQRLGMNDRDGTQTPAGGGEGPHRTGRSRPATDGGSILIDSGTTCLELVRNLPADLAISVVTNSLQASALLAELPQVELLFLGGRIRDVTGAGVGPGRSRPWPASMSTSRSSAPTASPPSTA